jgi:hypothetical protein
MRRARIGAWQRVFPLAVLNAGGMINNGSALAKRTAVDAGPQ